MKSIRFLVVDDEEDLVHMFSHFLERNGHVSKIAKNSESALNLVRAENVFDVAIVDYLLRSKMDGLQVIQEIRKSIKNPPECFLISSLEPKIPKGMGIHFVKKPFSIFGFYEFILSKIATRNSYLEKRKAPRFLKQLEFRFIEDSRRQLTSDVSLGGFFANIKTPLNKNEEKIIELKVNNDFLQLPVKVVWKREKDSEGMQGAGFQFGNIPAEYLSLLKHYFEQG